MSAPAVYRPLSELTLADVESIRLLLRGSSVIDWARLAFRTETDVTEFLGAHEFDLSDPASRARSEAIKNAAIQYLRRNFDFPIPKPVSDANVAELLLVASGRGHRQLCACTILKVMHIIHHLEARELLYMLPISDQDVFHLVEQKVYRVIGSMLARGLPILEFIGGRKNKDSLYSKLLSKKETHAAQIYDKLRFRIVTRSQDDVFPVLAYLERVLFPFNYIVPGESTNTMFDLLGYLRKHPSLSEVAREMQPTLEDDAEEGANDNVFSSASYRIVHFVIDLPVRLPDDILELAPPAALGLGRVVFAQAEFQVVDRETEQSNELGDASHDAYKDRQKQAVVRRLKLGAVGAAAERTGPAIALPPVPASGRASTSSLPPPAKASPKPPAPRTQPRRKKNKRRR
ncbi:MAG: TIGR04552 family protein [Sandaracinus sp.]